MIQWVQRGQKFPRNKGVVIMTNDELNTILEKHKKWTFALDGGERANLRGANLRGADLCGANLRDANLCGANLCGAKNVPFIPYACPDFGSFIGYKKCDSKIGKVIVELEILSDARRCSATGRKCRCDKAKVLAIQNLDGTTAIITEARSNYNADFVYRVGEIVEVKDFCEDRWQECSEGIHFFINRQEAVNY